MNKELKEAMDILEKEKEISKETLFEAIENSLITACKQHFGKADNIKVEIDRETCDFLCYAEKELVPMPEDVEDYCLQICFEDAKQLSKRACVGDIIHVEIKSKEFGRIATQNAKNVILQKIREEERSVVYNQYFEKEKDFTWNLNEEQKEELKKEITEGFTFAKKVVQENMCDMLILDEVMASINGGYIKEEEVAKLIESKPNNMELVLTGRDIPELIAQKSDLITEMKEIKHYFNKGIPARKGIEF